MSPEETPSLDPLAVALIALTVIVVIAGGWVASWYCNKHRYRK